jgi:hypothetical protein
MKLNPRSESIDFDADVAKQVIKNAALAAFFMDGKQ